MRLPKKLEIAVSRMVVREPFYASLLLDREIIESNAQPTFCTDGAKIWYNTDFLDSITEDETIGTTAHETLHIGHLHMFRRNGRDMDAWNIACDYFINSELLKAGFILPKGALVNPSYDGLSEEQIYAKLPPGGGGGGGTGKGPGGSPGKGKPGQPQPGQGQPQPGFGQFIDPQGTQAEVEEVLNRTKVEIFRAAQVAKSQGKLPASMASWVESIKHPKVPWQHELRDCLNSVASDDYTFLRPNRRYMHTGFSMPSLHNYRCGTVAVCIDTSGSIGQDEFNQFIGELRDILQSVKPERTILIQCDSGIPDEGYKVYENGEQLEDKIQMVGGGGTSFCPPFERLEREGEQPDALVYLTDACGSFPKQAPDYPVIWAVTTSATVPWGRRIELSLS